MSSELSTNNITFSCRVSSTINKDVKLFGKQFMFDGNDETCWNSDMGETQWIMLMYEKAITFSNMKIQFQGGFAAEECHLEILNDNTVEFSKIVAFADNNTFQNIDLLKTCCANKIKLKFNKMYDTYGRIVVYHLTFNT